MIYLLYSYYKLKFYNELKIWRIVVFLKIWRIILLLYFLEVHFPWHLKSGGQEKLGFKGFRRVIVNPFFIFIKLQNLSKQGKGLP